MKDPLLLVTYEDIIEFFETWFEAQDPEQWTTQHNVIPTYARSVAKEAYSEGFMSGLEVGKTMLRHAIVEMLGGNIEE